MAQSVLCEKHGLRYDPESQSGCVFCRREAGEVISAVPTAQSAPPPGVPAAAQPATVSMGPSKPKQGTPQALAMILSGLLIFTTASVFFFAHGRIANFVTSEALAEGIDFEDDYFSDEYGFGYEDESGDAPSVDSEALRKRLEEIQKRAGDNSSRTDDAGSGDDYDPYDSYYDYD